MVIGIVDRAVDAAAKRSAYLPRLVKTKGFMPSRKFGAVRKL